MAHECNDKNPLKILDPDDEPEYHIVNISWRIYQNLSATFQLILQKKPTYMSLSGIRYG